MARIRSLKIGFFENEELAQHPFEARLLFEGLWLLADREGRLEDRPLRIKARLFPYDTVDVDHLLDGLHTSGFILRYVADGSAYIQVVRFTRHQRPKADEAASLIPAPGLENPRRTGAGQTPISDCPALGQRDIGQRTEDREGKGRDADGASPSADVAESRSDADGAETRTPDAFAALWNLCTALPIPRCRELSSKRRRQIRARMTERPWMEWEAVFRRIQASPFCRGENDRGWTATFDWVIGSPDAAVKVLEGKYDDRRSVDRRPSERSRTNYVPTAHADYDLWPEECRALHGGTCSNFQAHRIRVARDTEAAAS